MYDGRWLGVIVGAIIGVVGSVDRLVRTGTVLEVNHAYIHIIDNIPIVGATVGPYVGFVGENVGAADGYVGATVM